MVLSLEATLLVAWPIGSVWVLLSLEDTLLVMRQVGCTGRGAVGKVGTKVVISPLTSFTALDSKITYLEGASLFLPTLLIFNFLIASSRLLASFGLKQILHAMFLMLIDSTVGLCNLRDPLGWCNTHPTKIITSPSLYIFLGLARLLARNKMRPDCINSFGLILRLPKKKSLANCTFPFSYYSSFKKKVAMISSTIILLSFLTFFLNPALYINALVVSHLITNPRSDTLFSLGTSGGLH